jgi:hypothetical protein
VLIAEKTLPGTFVKIHITNLKPFKSSDLYGVVYKVIKIKFEQFHSYQYNLQAFEKHRSLLSTFSMLRYLVVMYLCAIDIYFASGKNPIFRQIKSNNSGTAKVKIIKNERHPPLFTGKLLIKFQKKFVKFEQFHSYQYNLQAFEKHRSLLSTFSMLRYLVVMC